jgi:phosphoglycolate phosphatase
VAAGARTALLFDLDGTLTDPFVGISRSVQYAMEKLGQPVPSADDLRWCIGPPLKLGFARLLDTDDDEVTDEAVRLYRERYATIGKFENSLIDGVPEILSSLSAEGHFLSIATSKLKTYAGDIIDHFGLAQYFDALHGSELDGRNALKGDLVRHILATERIEPGNAIMIGDREHDIHGANANGVAAIGVLWGYGDRTELERAGAHLIATRPKELPELIDRVIGRSSSRSSENGSAVDR